MPMMIDPTKVEDAIAHMHEVLSPHLALPGQEGTTARAMLAILPVIARWSTSEFSRNTPLEETLNALGVAISNAVASELDGIDCALDDKIGHLNAFLMAMGSGVVHIIAKPDAEKQSSLIPAEEAGHA